MSLCLLINDEYLCSMLLCQAVAEDYNEPEEDGEKQTRPFFNTPYLTTWIFWFRAMDSLIVLDESLLTSWYFHTTEYENHL